MMLYIIQCVSRRGSLYYDLIDGCNRLSLMLARLALSPISATLSLVAPSNKRDWQKQAHKPTRALRALAFLFSSSFPPQLWILVLVVLASCQYTRLNRYRFTGSVVRLDATGVASSRMIGISSSHWTTPSELYNLPGTKVRTVMKSSDQGVDHSRYRSIGNPN